MDFKKCITALAAVERELTKETAAALANESLFGDARALSAGFRALSLLRIGLLWCAADGRVLGTNEIADEILANHDGLELTRDRMLRVTEENELSLEQLLHNAGKGTRNGQPASSVLALRRGSLRSPLTLLIRASAATGDEGSVLIMIMDSSLPVRPIESELRQLYGLSSMEARLANLLVQGHSLEECCQELGFRRSTGCTHLKRLFKKTGVHRQTVLVSLLLKSIGLVYLGGGNAKPRPADALPIGGPSMRVDRSWMPAETL